MSNEDAYFVTNFSVTILTDSLLFKITQVVDCLRCFKSESSKKKSHPNKRRKVHSDRNISIQNFSSVSTPAIFTRGGVFMIRT